MALSTFTVPTKGYCFICLKPETTNSEKKVGDELFSLHKIHRYLNINLKKSVKEMTSNPLSPTLEELDKSEMMAVLCSGCVKLCDNVSNYFSQLELAQMKVNYCLKLIQDKMEGDKDQFNFRRMMLGSNKRKSSGAGLQLKIVEKLREEMKDKCSRKLEKAIPRVKLKRWTPHEERNQEDSLTNDVDVITVRKNGKERAKCGICKKVMSSKTAAHEHIDAIHKKLKFQCSGCGRKFSWKSNYTVHRKRQCGGVKCKDCDKQFFTVKDLNNHQKGTKHKGQIRILKIRYQCNRCEKSFSTCQALRQHYLRHLCEKDSLNGQQGTLKEKTEEDEKSLLNCQFCDRTFSSTQSVENHISAIHKGIKYSCHKCGKKFSWKDNLAKHIKFNKCHTRKAKQSSKQSRLKVDRLPEMKFKTICNELEESESQPVVMDMGFVKQEMYEMDVQEEWLMNSDD